MHPCLLTSPLLMEEKLLFSLLHDAPNMEEVAPNDSNVATMYQFYADPQWGSEVGGK